MRQTDATRPDDRELLRSALARLKSQSGVPVLYGGLVEGNALTITELLGTSTQSLRRLWVQPGEGVGGASFKQTRLTVVSDYVESAHISHHHDEAVRMEGLRSMMAAPVVVEGKARAVLYAATRQRTQLGEIVANDVMRLCGAIAGELRVRDEVDRRVSLLRGTEPETDPHERDTREAMRIAYGELVALAGSTDDPELARSILEITEKLVHQNTQANAATLPVLTRRELDVLSQVALGCSYPETARRLALKSDTVKGYMQTITRKLGAHSRHEAVASARRLGLLP